MTIYLNKNEANSDSGLDLNSLISLFGQNYQKNLSSSCVLKYFFKDNMNKNAAEAIAVILQAMNVISSRIHY